MTKYIIVNYWENYLCGYHDTLKEAQDDLEYLLNQDGE